MKQITQFFLEDKRDESPTFNDFITLHKKKSITETH